LCDCRVQGGGLLWPGKNLKADIMVVAGSQIQNMKQWPAMLALLFICSLSWVTVCTGEPDPPPRPQKNLTNVITSLVSGDRDSMMSEIKRYSEEIAVLRDSLTMAGDNVEISDDQRIRFQNSIDDMAVIIGEITEELSHLEFQVSDNMISLLDESGEGIVINIPENLDDQVKEGIESITQIILAQLPDTVQVDPSLDWNWFGGQDHAPEVRRQISHGNIVKVWDDLYVSPEADIRGNVVVVVGDVRIEGRIDGDVTVVLGDLELAENAEILGNVVMVMGRVEEEGDSFLDNVTVIDPFGSGNGLSLSSLSEKGGLVFITSQGVFIFVLMVVLLGMGFLPESRIISVRSALLTAPGASLGIGFVVSMLGHLVVVLLVAMLILTVIGIPLALLFVLAMGLIWIMATGGVALVLGEKLSAVMGVKSLNRWACVLAGMMALHLISFLGGAMGTFPGLNGLGAAFVMLGTIIKTIAYLFGLGALLTSKFGTKVPHNS